MEQAQPIKTPQDLARHFRNETIVGLALAGMQLWQMAADIRDNLENAPKERAAAKRHEEEVQSIPDDVLTDTRRKIEAAKSINVTKTVRQIFNEASGEKVLYLKKYDAFVLPSEIAKACKIEAKLLHVSTLESSNYQHNDSAKDKTQKLQNASASVLSSLHEGPAIELCEGMKSVYLVGNAEISKIFGEALYPKSLSKEAAQKPSDIYEALEVSGPKRQAA